MEDLVLISPNSLSYSKKIKSCTRIIIKEFPDGESYIRLPGEFRGKRITFIHRCYPDQDKSLIQLLLILQTLKNNGAAFLRVIIPYLPYSRKNKLYLSGEVLSSKIICRLLHTSGCDELVTIEYLRQ
jgi:ribose-phosphate pyrophosphokinase